MTWIRYDEDLLEKDPDLGELDRLRRHWPLWWLNLVILARKAGADGQLLYGDEKKPWRVEHLARRARTTPRTYNKFLDAVLELSLLEKQDEAFRIPARFRYLFESPAEAADRAGAEAPQETRFQAVHRLKSTGKSNRAIARDLGVSEKSVRQILASDSGADQVRTESAESADQVRTKSALNADQVRTESAESADQVRTFCGPSADDQDHDQRKRERSTNKGSAQSTSLAKLQAQPASADQVRTKSAENADQVRTESALLSPRPPILERSIDLIPFRDKDFIRIVSEGFEVLMGHEPKKNDLGFLHRQLSQNKDLWPPDVSREVIAHCVALACHLTKERMRLIERGEIKAEKIRNPWGYVQTAAPQFVELVTRWLAQNRFWASHGKALPPMDYASHCRKATAA